ncbi:MAG: hypothetical protein IJW03_05835 [Clostridia bacterium]|nr:hypothetical protein [Clostridia bacterium]
MRNAFLKKILATLLLITTLTSISACSFITQDGDGEKDKKPDIPGNNDGPGETDDTTPPAFDAEEELLMFEQRFDNYKGTLSDEAIEQVKRLYSFYGDDVYEWIANLWDNEIGAFYYANSSRDYEGFLPDIESTRQALAIIRTSGMVDVYGSDADKAFVKVFPKEFADKIVAFVKSCQDPESGYFYHKQWGYDVSASRRGRDLDQALTLLALFGEKPDYPTILDRLSGTSPTSLIERDSYVSATSVLSSVSSSLPEHLSSKEAFKKYLDSFDIVRDSHSTGHVIASQASQIKAAGLIDFACDYFDEIQERVYREQVANGETPSGLWQPEVNYTSISGLYKMGGLYDEAGRCINYLDECIRSGIEVIKQDVAPTDIIYVYNPWAGMSTAIRSMKRSVSSGSSQYDLEATYGIVRSELDELIKITVDKLSVFRKQSGGFSYYRDYSASATQGVPVSLGLAEGDLNATNIAINSISGHIFASAGLERPDIWNFEDFDRFIGIMKDLDPVKKQKFEVSVIDFEDSDIGTTPLLVSVPSPSGVDYDPEDDDNKALRFYSPATAGTRGLISTNLSGQFSCAVFEADFMVKNSTNGTTHQIKLQGPQGNMYMFTLSYNGQSDTLTLGDSSHHTGGVKGSLSVPMQASKWNKIRLEVYVNTESELTKNGFIVKVFLNEQFVDYTTNYFGPTTSNADVAPTVGFTKIELYGMASPESELWIDNIFFDMPIGQIFEEE